jgi:glycine cleavage system aminomethyltransferase T
LRMSLPSGDRWPSKALKAIAAIETVTGTSMSGECPGFKFLAVGLGWGAQCYVARTGYTGEDGAEIFVPWDKTEALWNLFFEGVPGGPSHRTGSPGHADERR